MTRVLRACVSAIAVAALAGTAVAADLPPRYPAPIPKAPVYNAPYNWTGLYVGINGGGAWGSSEWDYDREASTSPAA